MQFTEREMQKCNIAREEPLSLKAQGYHFLYKIQIRNKDHFVQLTINDKDLAKFLESAAATFVPCSSAHSNS